MHFVNYIRRLLLNRSYVFYALAYGLSTLILPFAVQFLVNNLALSGIWGNIVVFLSIIAALLIVSQILRHSQVVLIEYLQREIFVTELTKWRELKDKANAHYSFEIYALLKSYSKAYSDFIDMALVSVFGIATIVIFHPAFLLVAVFTGVTVYLIHRVYKRAFETSVAESNKKYEIYDMISEGKAILQNDINDYLQKRDTHFGFIRGISFKISVLHCFIQIYVISIGCYLIHLGQLSVGQLVAAEIIISGIAYSNLKLPVAMESLYDFETSIYKIDYALKGSHDS